MSKELERRGAERRKKPKQPSTDEHSDEDAIADGFTEDDDPNDDDAQSKLFGETDEAIRAAFDDLPLT